MGHHRPACALRCCGEYAAVIELVPVTALTAYRTANSMNHVQPHRSDRSRQRCHQAIPVRSFIAPIFVPYM